MRDYLKNGSILELTAEKASSKYVIEELCGQGTNCIVYEAHSLENNKKSRKVRIKEFYPSAAVARREESRLVWKTNPEKLKKGFLETYQKQIALQNNVVMGNTSAHIVDKIYEANDTLYIVVDVDYGWTFDQDAKHTNNLQDVLKTMIALSKTIKKYHDQGMLYLDIKPQNFLILPETREMIKMIDTDTIIYKEDLFKGKVTSIPFSQGWAAPEQLQGKIRLISEQTDIYAIGAVLYERLLGQRLTSKEINIHLEIPIEKSIIKIENNNIKNSICAILKKALAVSPQKRYESIDILIEAFSDVLEKSYKKMYLRDNCPASNIYFVGREDELEEIHEQFEAGKNVVFLQGFGGIGKSELAKKYAEMYKESYEHTLFYTYYDSIDEVIKSIDIIGYEKFDDLDQLNQSGQLEQSERSDQSERSGQSKDNNKNRDEKKAKLSALKELCSKEKVLFILDNLDVEPEKAINLEEFVNLGAKVLITTRCDYDGYFENTSMQMKLDVLDRNELTEIFEHYYKSTLDSSEKEKIYKIFRKIDNYTLLVPIMAKYVSGAGITVSEFYDEFMEQSLSGYDEGTDKIRQIKDGTIYNATMMGHARRLFNIMSLKEEYKQVLVNLWYLDMYKMLDKKMYRRFTGSRNLNALNYMIEIGLVQETETYYDSETVKCLTIHPIIEELVETDIDHDPEQVQGIWNYVENGFKDISNKSSAGDTDKFYRILAMYTKFVDYDEHKEEKCRVIGDLIERLYDKKEYFIIANIFNGKGMFIDGHHGAKLKYTAKPEFFIEKIIELNRSISVNTDIIDYVKKILNSLIVGVELTNYKIRQGNSDIYDDVKKIYREFTRGASFYSTVIEIIDGNNCSDELNKVMEMINDTIIKMIMCLKSFLNIEFLNDSYTDKNEKIYNSRRGQQLKCDGNNILIGSLFYSVAVLIEYYLKNNSDENTAQILSDLHNKIGFEMYYAIGEIHNPFDVKNFSVNEIIEKYPEYFLDLEGAPLERFFCPIRDEYKQKRHDLLASSMIKMMEEADREHAANLICMCFNKDFLIEHPLEVLAALSEKSWLLNYYRNHELSKEEKIQIMDTWSQNIYKLILSKTQYIHNTEEAKREIAHIFKKITDLYMLLLPDFTELNKDLIGTPFLENRKQFYSSVFMLSKWYSIDIDIHTDQLMKELTDNNIPYLDRIVECIKRLSGYGHRKEAVELKQNLFSLYTREYDENNMESYAKKVIVLMILQKLAKGMHMTEYYEKITKEMESAPLEVYAYIRDHSDKVTLAMAQKVTKIMARRFICRIVDLIDVDCKTEEIYDRVFDDSKLIEEYRKYMAYRLDAMFVTFDYPVYPAEVLILMYFEFYLSGWDEFNYYVFEEHEEQKIEMFYRSFNMNKEEVNVELLYFLMTLYGKNIGKYILNHVHNYQLDLENRTFFDHLLDYVEEDEY